jgi:predicted RNA binding protein YcfA (HicA-like mRNA interferase family)
MQIMVEREGGGVARRMRGLAQIGFCRARGSGSHKGIVKAQARSRVTQGTHKSNQMQPKAEKAE